MSRPRRITRGSEAIGPGGVVTLAAIGEFPNFNDKADFDQLPIEIFPPQFGFYFIHQDITLPAIKPFCYSEVIIFPISAKSITIIDADGRHVVDIEEICVQEPTECKPTGSEKGFCVFAIIGGTQLLIAKCDSILPAIYTRVFGPATYAECEQYVGDNKGK